MPRNAQHQLALDLLQSGNLKEALVAFEGALHEAESSDLWNDWGVAQAALGELEAASRSFRRALELDPHNADAVENLRTVNDPASHSAKASTSSNDQGSKHHQLAKLCFQQGRLKDAAHAICRALELGETSARWNDYGTIALALASLEEAERGYRRAVDLDQTNTTAATNLVVLLARLKRFEEADQYRHLTNEVLLNEQENQVKEVYRRYEAANLG